MKVSEIRRKIIMFGMIYLETCSFAFFYSEPWNHRGFKNKKAITMEATHKYSTSQGGCETDFLVGCLCAGHLRKILLLCK